MACYNCGKRGEEGIDLKQLFYIWIDEKEKRQFAKELLISGRFAIGRNIPSIPSGLCQECMALAFYEAASTVRNMSDGEFKAHV